MEFLHPAMWHDHDINFARWLVTAPCNVACGSEIMTVNSTGGSRPTLQHDTWLWDDMSLNSPGGSTLQCGSRLWDDMPLNLPKRPPYSNSTSGFNFGHITSIYMSFCTSLWNFIQIGPPLAEKKLEVHSVERMYLRQRCSDGCRVTRVWTTVTPFSPYQEN